jgi:hypothetical protein
MGLWRAFGDIVIIYEREREERGGVWDFVYVCGWFNKTEGPQAPMVK